MVMLNILTVSFDDQVKDWKKPLITLPENVIVFMLEGNADYWLNGNHLRLQKGDVLFIPEGTHRKSQNIDSQLHKKYTILFNVDTAKLNKLTIFKSNQYNQYKTKRFEYLKQKISLLHHEFFHRNKYYDIVCEGALLNILASISRELDTQYISPQKIQLANKVEKYIQENYDKNISTSDTAQHINCTTSYTIRLFKEVKGHTPMNYIHHVRIAYGNDLLLNTPLSIQEIANQLGFSDPSHFNRVYKKIMGEPPSVIRRNKLSK